MKLLKSLIVISCLLVCGGAALAQKSASDNAIDIKMPGSGSQWSFSRGGEFPGAQGDLTAERIRGQQSGKIAYNFVNGGNYVMASSPVNIPDGYGELRFRVIGTDQVDFTVRITDATGQVHQIPCGSYSGNDQWQTMRVDLLKQRGGHHWGGANDGVLHWPLTGVAILVGKNQNHLSGSVAFTDLKFIR